MLTSACAHAPRPPADPSKLVRLWLHESERTCELLACGPACFAAAAWLLCCRWLAGPAPSCAQGVRRIWNALLARLNYTGKVGNISGIANA